MLLENSNYTITLLPAGQSQSTVISNRDIGWNKADNKPCCSKWSNIQSSTRPQTSDTESTMTNENEVGTPLFDALASELADAKSNSTTPIERAKQSGLTKQNTDDTRKPLANQQITANQKTGKTRKTAGQTMKELKRSSTKQQNKLKKEQS